jgi:hypothetical protein
MADMIDKELVAIVRCRNCKFFCECELLQGSNLEYISYCERLDLFTRTTDFCSHGKRRENADNVNNARKRIPWEAD